MDFDNEPSNEEILASLEEKEESPSSENLAEETQVEAENLPEEGFNFKSLDDLHAYKLKYQASGKEVEESISDILKRASQGYHYSQRMGELKAQEQEWQRQLAESQAMADKYREIDQYARDNPEWFDYWNSAYQNRGLPVGSPEQMGGFDPAQITSLIDQKLAPFQETIQQQKERMELEKRSQEDAALDAQVKATRQEFADVDFSATDIESGQTLEHRVYQFMIDNGVNDFNQAYKMMDYDNILARRVEAAKADLVKQEQMKRRQGIVGETSGQAKTPQAPVDYRQMTPDQFESAQAQFLNQIRSQGG